MDLVGKEKFRVLSIFGGFFSNSGKNPTLLKNLIQFVHNTLKNIKTCIFFPIVHVHVFYLLKSLKCGEVDLDLTVSPFVLQCLPMKGV